MLLKTKYWPVLLSILMTACAENTEKQSPAPVNSSVQKQDTCANRDTTFHETFTAETGTADFYTLVDFIKTKEQVAQKGTVSKDTGLYLMKDICPERGFDTPLERWELNNVFSLSISFVPTRKKDELKKIFLFTQINCINQQETERIWEILQHAGWGDPLKKWNEYKAVKGKNRIYILAPVIAASVDVTQRLAKLIEQKYK
jgi:hypothetical protein